MGKTYILLRKLIRSLILRSPLLERLFAPSLIALEGLLPQGWFARMVPNPIVHHGHTIFHRPEDLGVTLPIIFHGEYEPETTAVLRKVLKPGMTFVDLGAHIGWYTLLAARLVRPDGKVYAFEPVPSTFELLVKNVRVNGYEGIVTPVPKAVSDKSGRVRIFLDKGSSVSAKLVRSYNGQAFVEVEATSLDEFFRERGWPPVHLVKMDIEGAEKSSLEGMEELSQRNLEMTLIIEVNFKNLVQAGISLESFFETLQACGFARFRVLYRHTGDLEIPKDIHKLAALVHRLNVNLLCERR